MPVIGITIRRRGVSGVGSVSVLKWYGVCTTQVMTVRPLIEEETVERLDEKLEDVMAVDPESVGLDKKIGILIDSYENQAAQLRRLEMSQNDGPVNY